ncbi:MAG: S-methyl-5-thioribose-1-phosphate isomerase [Ignavibacteriales bacterium]|nr:S-methyl-5-thioribose-1-phosphate isomerase [Ignavibacteriales bacterium]
MIKTEYFSLKFIDKHLVFLDQTQLPFHEKYVKTTSYERVAEAIEKLEIRGAPAIGLAAAYAVVFSQENGYSKSAFNKAVGRLAKTRPTAVNLFWALNNMQKVFASLVPSEDSYSFLLHKAHSLYNDDVAMCDAIAVHGASLISKGSVVLTHCNTGRLAMGGGGTALYVIKKAFDSGNIKHVFVDETRPLLQGARLTAFELTHHGIPFSVITDSMAAHIIKTEKVNLVITGADRITSNGDSANKIGTYSLAILCKYHGIPFYIAAPSSTIDASLPSGDKIVLEERGANEISQFHSTQLTDSSFPVRNPSFDVTPCELITGIITESGVFDYPYKFV